MAENINSSADPADISDQLNTSPPSNDALFELLGKIISSQPNSAPSDNNSQSQTSQQSQIPPLQSQPSLTPNTGQGDMLSSLLSNPELLAKLPQILSIVKPLMGSMSDKQMPTQSSPLQQDNNISKPTAALPIMTHRSNAADSRAALLCAMKPYLGKERREAVDYIIKLSKLGDILKTL